MKWIQLARALGGLMSVMSLLLVLVLHVIHPKITVSTWVVAVFLTLIGGLLAVDVFGQEFPGQITIDFDSEKENNE